MATYRKIATTTALAAGLVVAVLGIGSGTAGASPAHDPGMIPMDHGWGGGDWDDHHGWGWGHRGWGGGDQGWGGPGWPPPCVTVPFVSICA
ncbi:hypothetical protein [Mycolicibacterium llatzerense]|uniref:hypothetical protein n=1 Tax=Mycolicibacterium llatzerense TaxID=280871 RepID=UPI0009F63F1C|nr:hypothetical protein [Mycolicibacterium llatzerense]